MWKALSIIAVLLQLALTTTSDVLAGPNSNAGLVFHIAEVGSSDLCLSSRIPTCCEVQESVAVLGIALYVYSLVIGADADAGVGGVSMGIQYPASPGFEVHSWTLCADNESGSGWPASGSGNIVSWDTDNCQHRRTGSGGPLSSTGAAVLGYFYCTPYAPSQMAVRPHPMSGTATITDCSGVVDDLTNHVPSQLGVAGFGGAPGYKPCFCDIHAYPCDITGPDHVPAGSGNHHYSASPEGSLGNFWQIAGDGSIVGSSEGTSVVVQAGGPGTFELRFVGATSSPPHYVCTKIVIVSDATPVTSASWSRIKTLYQSK